MSLSLTRAAALLLVATLGVNLAGCADDCRPRRGWDQPGDHGRWGHHRCDRHRDRRY
jgi:hypothetical protein